MNGFLTSPMYNELENELVSAFLSENHNSWDMDILSDLCNDRDRNLILQIPISNADRVDLWY